MTGRRKLNQPSECDFGRHVLVTHARVTEERPAAGELGRAEYPATSLGNKSLENVVKDIVELLVPEKAVGAT